MIIDENISSSLSNSAISSRKNSASGSVKKRILFVDFFILIFIFPTAVLLIKKSENGGLVLSVTPKTDVSSKNKPLKSTTDDQPSSSHFASSKKHRGSKNLSRMNHVFKKSPSSASVSATKPANQIPIETFWKAVEPYFKNIDEDELKLLRPKVR